MPIAHPPTERRPSDRRVTVFRARRSAAWACGLALWGVAAHGAPPEGDAAPAAAPRPLPGQLDLLLRTYVERLQVIDGPLRHGTIQSARLVFRSDLFGGGAAGQSGVGFDLGVYGALRLDGGRDSRNMALYRADGSGVHDKAWAYLGEYAMKGELGGSAFKYGLQMVSNPYLQPYDIRALPPTFRGLSLTSSALPGVSLAAGRFDGVIPRGDDRVRGLSTAYGGLPFDRFEYLGASASAGDSALSLWASRSSDLWNQYHVSASSGLRLQDDVQLTAQVDAYLTRDTGARRAGRVDTDAASLSVTARKGHSSLTLVHQKIAGDEFMDYTGETAGIFLGNARGVDFNAPHERSWQVRYTFDGNRAGLPGWTLMAWTILGHGSDARRGAAAHADPADPLHSLYWKNGAPASGGQQEWAIKSVYTVQEGRHKGMRIAAYVYRRRVDPQYPSRSFDDMQLTVNYPLRVL
jgi:hypothetical protein